MFNWFLSKIELKNNNSIMSSFHNKKGLKLNSDIAVPNNFELLVFYKEKHYNTLSSGKYKMDKKTFLDLIEVQQRKNSKLKHIKCVLHYINIAPQKLEIKFKNQCYNVEFTISNTLDFASLLLLYSYKVDNDYTISLLNELFHEILLYCKGNYKQITNNMLNKYGITINSFVPNNYKTSIFNTKPIIDTVETSKPLTQEAIVKTNQSQDQESKKIIEQNEQANPKIDTHTQDNVTHITNSPKTFPACPKCNHIAKFNTTYCLRCGYKLQ